MGADGPRLTRFPNGFELLFLRNRAAPVLALDLWVRVGSAHESPGEAGIAHFVEHMFFKGTERRSPGDIAREVEGIGGEINAYTSFDHTVYTLVVASRFADLGLDILSDAVHHSTFDAEELAREKKVVLEEIKRGLDLPHHYLSRLLFSEMFKAHPYGRPVIGREETVASFSRNDCLDFVRRWYRPGNMTLVVVGDDEPGEFAARVGAAFGSSRPPMGPSRVSRAKEPRALTFRGRFEPRRVTDVYFDLAFPGPAASHADVPALDLLTTILGQGEASRLQHRIKLDRNLVRSIGAGTYTPRDPGLIYLGGIAAPGRFEEAYSAICEEVFRLCHEPVGARELQRAKENVEADFIYQKETVQGQAQKVGFFHVVLGDADAETRYLSGLREVEVGTVRAVARKYFKASRGVLALLHPEATPPPWTPEEASSVTSRLEAESGRGLRRRTRRRSPVTRRELPNGARVLVKANPEVPVVAVRAAFVGGTRREPKDIAGAFHLMASGQTRGTRGRTVFEVAHGIDAIGGQLDGFSGRNSFGLKGEFLSKYLEDGMDLFADVLLHPTFPAEELEKVREDTLASIRLRRDNPAGYSFRMFEETLYGDHPFGRDVLGRPEVVSRLSAQTIQTLFSAAARPENLAVAVAGDVDPELVHEFLLRVLEPLDPQGSMADDPPAPMNLEAPRVRHLEAPIEQAHVVLGFLGTRIQSPDRYALRVANALLAGQGGRLFRTLRDERGLAYAVASACVEGLDRGYLAGYIATAPENVEYARDGLLQEFEKLANDGVSQEEVEQAQRKLVGGFEIALQENAFQAAQMALDEIYGIGYRTFEAFARQVFDVTPDAVVEAARRYLDLQAYACVVLGPIPSS